MKSYMNNYMDKYMEINHNTDKYIRSLKIGILAETLTDNQRIVLDICKNTTYVNKVIDNTKNNTNVNLYIKKYNYNNYIYDNIFNLFIDNVYIDDVDLSKIFEYFRK